MPLVIVDRVKETSVTTGSGNFTLAGASTGFQTFNGAVGVGNTCYYAIENPSLGEWEIGIGTLSSATNLVRTTVLKSSNSNSVVTFSSGSKNVYVTFSADQIKTYALLAGPQSLTNTTMSTNTTWNGELISPTYGGTGINNGANGISIAGNLTTGSNLTFSGAFAATITFTALTSVTLPTSGTLSTLAGGETFTNKVFSTNTTWNGGIINPTYGGTGINNGANRITIAGNLTTGSNLTFSGAFASTLNLTGSTNITLPTAGNVISDTSNLILPSMTGNSGKYLTNNGSTANWSTISSGITIANDTSTNSTFYLTFTNATSGSISVANVSSSKLYFNPSTGDLTAGGNITALSDERLKTNITTINNAVDKILKLRGVEFDWKSDNRHGIGLIAQEVEAIIPELVQDSNGFKSVSYGHTVAVIIEALKDIDRRLAQLEGKL